MAGTTAPVVRGWLRDLFTTATGDEVLVHYAWPGEENLGHRSVTCIGVQTSEVSYPTMRAGRQRRDERYRLRWAIAVHGEGMTAEEVDAECVAILAACEEALADNVDASGVATSADQQVIGVTYGGWETSEGPLEDIGYGFAYVLLVDVHARLL